MASKKQRNKKSSDKEKSEFSRPLKANYSPLPFKSKTLITIGFVISSFILYHQSLNYGYVLDDKMVIINNNYTQSGFDGISKIFSTDSFEGYLGKQMQLVQGGRYRPLSIASFAVEYEFFNRSPAISHGINIFLYGMSVALLFVFLRRLFESNNSGRFLFIGLAFFSACLFLFHPIHTEAVANIKGRDEILSFIFSILSFHLALKYLHSKKLLFLPLLSLSFFLGLLSKENTLTFLAIIPMGLLLFKRASYKQIALITSVLFTTVIAYLVLRYNILGYLLNSTPSSDIMNNPFVEMTGGQKYASIFYTLLIYIKLCIFPYPLTHDYYPYHIPICNWTDPWVLVSLFIHLGLIFLFFKNWKRLPIVSFGIGFYFIAMSIVSNIVVNVGTFMNERFAFTASLGICLLMAYFLLIMSKRINKNAALILLTIMCLGYSGLSFSRIPAWESELSLNSAAIKVSKNSARANSFMGTALFNRYKVTNDRATKKSLLDQAIVYVNKALEMMPDYSNANLMKAGIAAEYHKMGGPLENLLKSFKEVIIMRPEIGFIKEYLEYINNRADSSQMIDFYYDVGFNELIKKQKRYDWGVHYLKFGYQIDPNSQKLNSALKNAYLAVGNQSEAQKYSK